MNIKGLKNILREVDEGLTVVLSNKKGEEIFRKTLEEFMEDSTFDNYHCENMTPGFFFEYDVKYKSPEELKKAFVIEAKVSEEIDSSEEMTIHDFEWGFAGCESYWCLLHNSFVFDISNIHSYDEEDRQLVRRKMKEYDSLPLDYIRLRFDPEEIFEIYEDDPDAVYDEIEDGDILMVDVNPVLPNGMWLFR